MGLDDEYPDLKDAVRTYGPKWVHGHYVRKREQALLPPEGTEDPEAAIPPEFKALNELIPRLIFPKVEGRPVLDLPPPEPPPEPAAKAEAKPARPVKTKSSKT